MKKQTILKLMHKADIKDREYITTSAGTSNPVVLQIMTEKEGAIQARYEIAQAIGRENFSLLNISAGA